MSKRYPARNNLCQARDNLCQEDMYKSVAAQLSRDDVLQELAAGILAPALAQQTMLHVAECKLCCPHAAAILAGVF